MNREQRVLFTIAMGALMWSGIHPHDRLTWWLEIAPILVAVPVLFATGRRFPLTPLAYRLICVHSLILMIGGHYTYAEVPLGNWVRDVLGLERNHYDRLGHFAQGFVPAILAREILLRKTPLQSGGWLFFLTAAVCLAISACYEFGEWGAATLLGQSADAFLGSQGDVWDTHWDMLCALIGAITSQLFLRKLHDRQLRVLMGR